MHPDVAASLTTKGEISFETGDLVGGEAALLEALSASEATLDARARPPRGRTHPDRSREGHRKAGDVTRARARLERALGIWTKSYGPDDPDVGEVRKLLAELPA